MKTPLIGLLLLSLTACTAETTPPDVAQETEDSAPATVLEHVDAAGAAALLASGEAVTILDIRTPQEFESGHLAGAVLIDYNADGFAEEIEKLDKDATYLVHCESGGRSTRSLEDFERAGFARIVHLDGGIRGWKAAGQPVE